MAWFGRKRNTVQIEIVIAPPPVAKRSGARRVPSDETSSQRIVVPSDLMLVSWRLLFPAERMLVFGGRRTARGVRITSAIDVTGPNPSSVHVRACPQKLSQALIDLDRTGAHLALWLHSHPGEGAQATLPSHVDIQQDQRFREHYSRSLVGIIAVRDGWLRVFGGNVSGDTHAKWIGTGVENTGEDNVFRLAIGS